jgi:hypothetical protein
MKTRNLTAGILAAALMGVFGAAQANNTTASSTAGAQANAPACTDTANTTPEGCVPAGKMAKDKTAMGADHSASGHNMKGSVKGKVDGSVTDGNTNSQISSDSSLSTAGANGKDSHYQLPDPGTGSH